MHKPHILVVDDDIYVVESLKTYLELQGCQVTQAYSFRQAVEALRTQDKFDLMILDYLMADGYGTDLLRTMDEDHTLQRPPVIMSSGILDPKTPIWEKLKGRLPEQSQALIQAYVNKPYTFDAMDVAVQEILGGDYLPTPRRQRHPHPKISSS